MGDSPGGWLLRMLEVLIRSTDYRDTIQPGDHDGNENKELGFLGLRIWPERVDKLIVELLAG